MRWSDKHGKGSRWKLPLPMTLLLTSWLVGVRGAGYGVPESYPPWARVTGLASRSSQHAFARVFAGVKSLDVQYIDATGDTATVSFVPHITITRQLSYSYRDPFLDLGVHTRADNRWHKLSGVGTRPAPD
jgi:hypothetical protein